MIHKALNQLTYQSLNDSSFIDNSKLVLSIIA